MCYRVTSVTMRSDLQLSSICFLVALSLTIALAGAAWSQCNNLSSPGVVICTPTNNSTVAYNNIISVRSTPAQGATVTRLIIYDNNAKIYQASQSRVDLVDGGILNGEHHLVVAVWDSDGHLYHAMTNFYVTGLGYALCPQPSSSGVVICNPPVGGIYATYAGFDASARGRTAIKRFDIYLQGKLVDSIPNTWGIGDVVQLSGQNVNNTLKVVATDTSGNRYTASKTLNAKYTYGEYVCFNTCSPGINPIAPLGNAYVGNTFNLNMQILDNPRAITAMKAYLDNTAVASSSGPTLRAEIRDAPDGTHILTIQGWDDAGIEYRVQENININVHD